MISGRPIKPMLLSCPSWMTESSASDIFGRSKVNHVFRRGGIELVTKMFHCVGFYFDLQGEPYFNWFQIFLVTLISGFGCLLSTSIVVTAMKWKENWNFNDVCMAITILLITFRVPIAYVHCGFLMKKCNCFLQDLSAALDNISPLSLRQSYLPKIRRWTMLAVAGTVVTLVSGATVLIASLQVLKERLPETELFPHSESTWVFLTVQILVGLWYLMANSIPFICGVFTVLFCKLLVVCFDCYTPTEKVTHSNSNGPKGPFFSRATNDVDVVWHQCCHERLCVLVARANDVLSPYMLGFLIEQIVILLLYSQSGSNVDWLAGLFLGVKQTVLFVVTSLACSDVNEKLSSALFRTWIHSFEDLQYCSAEHIHYTMYLCQKFANTVKMTYGGVFTINKSFLFTIAGTTLTYTLVLKDFKFT